MSPERASIFQVVQIGKETTPGTPVPANKKLVSLALDPAIKLEVQDFTPTGFKYPTLEVLGKEWITAPVKGKATFDEIVYALAGILGDGVVTTPDAVLAPTARQWVFSPATSAADNVPTFTVEQGSAERAHRFAYAIFDALTMKMTREAFDIGGSVMGTELQDGIALTGGPTSLPLKPILPKALDVFMDPTAAAIGSTKLTRALDASWGLTGKIGPLWPMDSSKPSYTTHVESRPKLEIKLILEADTQGMGLLPVVRAGDTRFFRIQATGDNIGGAINYLFQLDFAAKVKDVGAFSDHQAVFAVEWTLSGVHDPGWGKALTVKVVNTTAVL